MQISELVRQLPPDKLNKMQSLMHNMMAGFDVRAEMAAFEQTLPAEFREKMMSIMGGTELRPDIEVQNAKPATELSMTEARLTVLRAVAQGQVTPEEAERLLFPVK